MSAFLRDDTGQDTLPAAIVSLQTAGEVLNWHPHLHVLAPAGAFRTDGGFVHSPAFDTVVLRGLFQTNVLPLLRDDAVPVQPERVGEWDRGALLPRRPTPGDHAPSRADVPHLAVGLDARGVEAILEGLPVAQAFPECQGVVRKGVNFRPRPRIFPSAGGILVKKIREAGRGGRR